MAADFVHLHTHSEYSLLDGLGKLDDLINRAKSFGMDSLAVTDHGAMYGAFKFYLKAKAAGIKPIIGVETYVARRGRFDKEAKEFRRRPGLELVDCGNGFCVAFGESRNRIGNG